jgi:O-acetyl-ADP-ribose deacetylase (regulator of RNase III)
METMLASGQTIQLVQGDITAETTGAIVNAANRYLQHGGGVAGAIARRGGPEIQAESNAWVQAHGPVPHESPAWTSGGQLLCQYIIHAVGPIWDKATNKKSPQRADTDLAACVRGSLGIAEQLGVESVAIPAISTGIFGFPKQRAAGLILKTIYDFFAAKPDSGLRLVRVVLYDLSTLEAFEKSWHDHFDA